MIRWPLCVCSDLDPSPPTLGCILCAVLCLSKSFFSFPSFGLVLFCFVFFVLYHLGHPHFRFACEFLRVLPSDTGTFS
jgi:hypothetical protein